jgi:hypothetical protein
MSADNLGADATGSVARMAEQLRFSAHGECGNNLCSRIFEVLPFTPS